MIKERLKRVAHTLLGANAQVLMYHRIMVPEQDVWNIQVSPQVFEEQLKVLKDNYRVIPLAEMVENMQRKALKRKSIAITFDDGYEDNYLAAKPLLEKYHLPATFFVTSGNIGTEQEFWWDSLQELILASPHLPSLFSLQIGKTRLETDLTGEEYLSASLQQKHETWKAYVQPPVSARSQLFLQLWETLRPLTWAEQQAHFQDLRAWAGIEKHCREGYRSMNAAQVQELARHPLFDLGGHTVSHAFLPAHPRERQQKELEQNKEFLQQVKGKSIDVFSYPYGGISADTEAAVREAGYQAAFTTQEKAIDPHTSPFQMGRVQVKNLGKKEFSWLLEYPR
ncbi:polysaccharide deacetylase family protein [Rufibacter soli]